LLLLLFDNSEQERSLKHPLLLLTSPPLQPTIIGYLPELGTITLENCCQVDRQVSTNLQTGLRSYRLFLKPTAIWLGSQKSIVEQTLSCLSLFDGRLEGFFKSPGLVNYMWPSDETKAGFEALGSPTAIWAFHGDAFPKFEVEAEGFNVQIESAAVHSSSSRTGYALQALTKITVKLIKLANISDYMRVKTRLEQMLSIFSLEGFSFEVPIYEGEGCSIALAWEWAQDTSLFTPPMQHQVLVDLSDKDVFAAICRGWFRSSGG
jgi:hypothetical protein